MLTLFLITLASSFAAPPVVERGDDSKITGHVDVKASAELAYALVSDPARVADFDPMTTVKVRKDGRCDHVTTFVDHPLAKATYETRSCPSGELAVEQTLLGGDMKEFESLWRVEPLDGGGARLHYYLRNVTTIALPRAIVDRAAAKSAFKLLERIRDHLDSKAGSDGGTR